MPLLKRPWDQTCRASELVLPSPPSQTLPYQHSSSPSSTLVLSITSTFPQLGWGGEGSLGFYTCIDLQLLGEINIKLPTVATWFYHSPSLFGHLIANDPASLFPLPLPQLPVPYLKPFSTFRPHRALFSSGLQGCSSQTSLPLWTPSSLQIQLPDILPLRVPSEGADHCAPAWPVTGLLCPFSQDGIPSLWNREPQSLWGCRPVHSKVAQAPSGSAPCPHSMLATCITAFLIVTSSFLLLFFRSWF